MHTSINEQRYRWGSIRYPQVIHVGVECDKLDLNLKLIEYGSARCNLLYV